MHVATNGLGVLPALTAKWRYGTPMIVSEHGIYLREQYLHSPKLPYRWPVKTFYLGFLRQLCALAYREAETITPCNIYNRRWEERLGADPSRIRTVYNGVDPANFPVVRGSSPRCPRSPGPGGSTRSRTWRRCCSAFGIVHQEMPEARLRLFGSPPKGRESYLERCKALVAELGIGEVVTLEGHTNKVRDAYHAGSIVALSSVSEGFPYSLIEAMTCGRTCVATDVGGVHRGGRRHRPGGAARAARPALPRPASPCCATTSCGTAWRPPPAPAPWSSSRLTARSAGLTRSTASWPPVSRCRSSRPSRAPRTGRRPAREDEPDDQQDTTAGLRPRYEREDLIRPAAVGRAAQRERRQAAADGGAPGRGAQAA